MRQYDKYINPGLEWINRIPSHWSSMPLKRYGRFNKGLTFTKADLVEDGHPVVSYGQVHSKNNNGTHLNDELIRFVPERFIENSYNSFVRKGDFIFADTSEDLEGSGNVVYNDKDMLIYGGYHTVLFQTKNDDNRFLAYLFSTDCWRSQVRSRVSGIKVFSITQGILSMTNIILPPEDEQKVIADYLDEKTAQIDNIIRARKKKILLLEELKTSIISKAVTKGIQKNVETKESGIEWIGLIPKHWNIIPFKRMFKLRKGLTITKADLVEDGVPVISYGQIHSKDNDGVHIKQSLIRYVPNKYLFTDKKSIAKEGDFIFADTSEDLDGCGNNIRVDRDFILFAGYHSIIATPKDSHNSPYFSYLFKTDAWRHVIRGNVSGVKLYSITQEILGKEFVLLPPIEEQHDIFKYLESSCKRIDTNILKAYQEIELLKEYRASLISEVVTGKRKVI